MRAQEILAKRIEELCIEQGISYYTLSYQAGVPLTTLLHIVDCSTRNPGLFTISKICSGLNVTLKDFFNTVEFESIGYEVE